MKRRPDWSDQLMWAVHARRDQPFAYGEHDCCLAAAALVEAMTGTDPVSKRLRGYTTARGAANRLRQYGGVAGLAQHVMGRHGCQRVRPRFAQRGDVVVCEVSGDAATGARALGVVGLDGRWAFVPNQAGGWAEVAMDKWVHAWRVP